MDWSFLRLLGVTAATMLPLMIAAGAMLPETAPVQVGMLFGFLAWLGLWALATRFIPDHLDRWF
jgi:hypothetical protein